MSTQLEWIVNITNGLKGENKKLEISIPKSILSSRKTDLNVIVGVVVFKTKKPKINLYRNLRHWRWLSWIDCPGLGRFSANCVLCHVLHRDSLQIENRLLMIWGTMLLLSCQKECHTTRRFWSIWHLSENVKLFLTAVVQSKAKR